MKRAGRLWKTVWQEKYLITVLLLGHLFWVLLGKQVHSILHDTADFFTRPTEAIALRWESWRYNRSQKVKTIEAAQQEIDTLRTELAALRLERQKDGERLIEADEAINLLGLKSLLPVEVQTARIVANNRNAPYGGIVADIGEDHNIKADQGVICADGVVGRIWTVGRSQSVVLPLDAHNASTGVMLARSRATGVLHGVKPGLAKIRYISSQETIQIGEPIYTSGLDRIFPRGLLIGYVASASPNLYNAYEMEIDVTLAAPLDRLGLLFVLPSAVNLELSNRLELPTSRRGVR